jgi:hypothetical protein
VYTPILTALVRAIKGSWRRIHKRGRDFRTPPDAGYSTETVLVTALLVMLAVAALAVLTSKVLAKVNSIDLG